MKIFFAFILSIFVFTTCQAAEESSASTEKMAWTQADSEQVSKYLGYMYGSNIIQLNSPSCKIMTDKIKEAIEEVLAGKEVNFSEAESLEIQQKKIPYMYNEWLTHHSQKNMTAGKEYIAKTNKTKDMIEIEPNMAYYKILKEGSGEDTVSESSNIMVEISEKYLSEGEFVQGDKGKTALQLSQIAKSSPNRMKALIGMKEGETRSLILFDKRDRFNPNLLKEIEITVFSTNVHMQKQQPTAKNTTVEPKVEKKPEVAKKKVLNQTEQSKN